MKEERNWKELQEIHYDIRPVMCGGCAEKFYFSEFVDEKYCPECNYNIVEETDDEESSND